MSIVYIQDLAGRVKKIRALGIIGTISSDVFQTRQLVEGAANGDPVTSMLYDRAMRPSVDNAAWVLFIWVPELETAGFLNQLLLDFQFNAFFEQIEKLYPAGYKNH